MVLIAENLSFHYPKPKVELFTQLSITIPPGVTLVQGGDGRGKSTLLRLMAGALAADAGQLRLNGVSLKEQPEAYRRQLFWMEPRSTDFDQLTPLQFFASLGGRYPGFDKTLLEPLVEGLGLEPHMDKRFSCCPPGRSARSGLRRRLPQVPTCC